MGLYLKITSIGSAEGRQFRIVDQMDLGRTQGSIIVDDPKMSARHAIIERDSDGLFTLKDLNSFNGIIVAGQRVGSLTLTKGLHFQLGKTTFEVVDLTSQEVASLSDDPHNSRPSWEQNLNQLMSSIKEFRNTEKVEVQPFQPSLVLHFIKGPQASKKILLGFGPRWAGALSLDIEIMEPHCPEQAFLILPTSEGPLFQTQYPYKVMINDTPKESSLLSEGDQIKIGNTVIKVYKYD